MDTDTVEVGYSIHGATFFEHVDGLFFAEVDNKPWRETAATSDSSVGACTHKRADVERSSPARKG